MLFNTKELADALRARRMQLNYTQEYLAAKLHISQNAYSKIELGHTRVTLERLWEITEILETDAIHILKSQVGSTEPLAKTA